MASLNVAARTLEVCVLRRAASTGGLQRNKPLASVSLALFFFHGAVRTFEKHCGVANECFARAVCRAGVSGEQLPVSCCPSLSFVAAGLAGVSVLYILVHTDGIKTFQLTMVKLP